MQLKVYLMFSLLLLSACSTMEPLNLGDSQIDLTWPSPPAEPRIKFLRTIHGPDDITPPHGKIRRYFDLLTGESNQGFLLDAPYAIGGDGEAVLYIADTTAGIVHKYDLKKREVHYLYMAGDEVLSSPVGVAVDSQKNLYVSDSLNGKVYKFDQKGKFLKELKLDKPFLRPAGIAVNSKDEKYLVDVLAHKLYLFDKNDHFQSEFPKHIEGQELNYPSNVAVDSKDNVYVTDSMNFTVKIYSSGGQLEGKIGEIGDSPGFFARPKGVAIDGEQHIYVVDSNLDDFQIFDRTGKLLLDVGKNGSKPGEFYLPSGIYIDKKNRIFVADTYNRRVQIFQYLKEGKKQ